MACCKPCSQVAAYHSYFTMRVHLQLVYFCCRCGCRWCWDGHWAVCCVFTCGVCNSCWFDKSTNFLVCPLDVALTKMFFFSFVSLLCRAAAAVTQLIKENSSLASRAWSLRTTAYIKVGLFVDFHQALMLLVFFTHIKAVLVSLGTVGDVFQLQLENYYQK